ncbi:CLUMA_CG001486, isoform A [Clunio marinus]|uniref:Cap-specific mRNA (nucleoside-2'-O-)-methyltransferase 1 n=1 Tax=Clunio marinus TaxID=568069 RepID=A0A1J1HI31_9DIPT|nr:CLUMA_CG001486, isoform A [Clunio marinus]
MYSQIISCLPVMRSNQNFAGNLQSQPSYTSSEDEGHKFKRLDSTASYTSEDESAVQNTSQSFMTQQSHDSVISYYNPASTDDEDQQQQQTSKYMSNENVKRTYSHTSDEADEPVSSKRQKLLSESTESPYPSDTEQPQRDGNNGQSMTSYDTALYSGPSMRMMEKMGYRKDAGLGRLGQGRVEPVEASQQRGRRGLGLRLDDLDKAAVKWDPAIEDISIPERVEWLVNHEPDESLLELSTELPTWIRRGPKKNTIDNETLFCDENILKRVLESKSVFDN